MLSKDQDDKYTIQSVENALDLLEAFSECDDEIRIAQMSQRLNLGKARVFRLLATFERRGYVEREKAGIYRLGAGAFEMAQKLMTRLTLLRKAKPVMESLAWNSKEAVYLGIRRGQDILLIDMVDTMEHVKIVPLLGNRYPLGNVAAGRVFLPDSANGSGYLIDENALGDGIVSIAVPLRCGRGDVCGSLILVGPAFRLTGERINGELLQLLLEAGEVISSKSGFFGRNSQQRLFGQTLDPTARQEFLSYRRS